MLSLLLRQAGMAEVENHYALLVRSFVPADDCMVDRQADSQVRVKDLSFPFLPDLLRSIHRWPAACPDYSSISLDAFLQLAES